MAQPSKKITALVLATALAASNLMLVVQGGVTKAVEVSVLQPPGMMTEYAAATAPAGWLMCNGQAVSRSTYADLYTAIGTTYGVGNGSTTFNVPDMREASPYGAGTYTAVTGTTHGTITAHDARTLGTFADDQEQGHRHALGGSGALEYVGTGGGANVNAGTIYNVDPTAVRDPTTDGINGAPRTGTVTRGKTLGLNYIIKY